MSDSSRDGWSGVGAELEPRLDGCRTMSVDGDDTIRQGRPDDGGHRRGGGAGSAENVRSMPAFLKSTEAIVTAAQHRPFVHHGGKYRFKFDAGTIQNEAIRPKGKEVKTWK